MWSFQLAVVTVLLFSFAFANIENEFEISNSIASTDYHSGEGELIFAHVIYRHGDRNINPIMYPNDPWRDEIHWPEGYGELTNEGKRQHYKLGQFFRRRYSQLLGKKYSPKQIYVRSSDIDRVISSALANLAGMFPPSYAEIWNENLKWQPIPVHTVQLHLDNIISNARKCPKFEVLMAMYMKESPEIQQIYSENVENFKHWTEGCGKNITSITDVMALYKTLLMETEHNKTIAPWAEKAIERNGWMEYISNYYFKLATVTRKLTRLSTGFLIKDIFERIYQKIEKTLQPDRSIYMYSAHDATIANLLNSLGLFEPHIPPYASSVLIELYKNKDNDHYIRIFYRKSDEENPSPLNIPNCGHKCTLDQLYELHGDIIPADFDTECNLT